jgi:hypothetical protein
MPTPLELTDKAVTVVLVPAVVVITSNLLPLALVV